MDKILDIRTDKQIALKQRRRKNLKLQRSVSTLKPEILIPLKHTDKKTICKLIQFRDGCAQLIPC